METDVKQPRGELNPRHNRKTHAAQFQHQKKYFLNFACPVQTTCGTTAIKGIREILEAIKTYL